MISFNPTSFQELLTHYRESVFTGDDRNIVSLRYLYLLTFDAHTYAPVNLVQVAAQQPKTMLTSAGCRHFAVVQSDFTIQFWDATRLEKKIQQMNYNPTGSINAMATATGGNRLICYGQARPWLGLITDINKGT